MFRYAQSAVPASLDGEEVVRVKARATIWSHEDSGQVTVAINYPWSPRGQEHALLPSQEVAFELLKAHGFHPLPNNPASWVLEEVPDNVVRLDDWR